ncbi:MAG: hypothetical protein WKF66_15945 [Pedobacter sp.]
MAMLNGDGFSGMIGPFVIRKMKDGRSVIQIKPRHYRLNAKSKKTTTMWGFGSTVACLIRKQLSSAVMLYDPGMVNRFNDPIRDVLSHCYNSKENVFNFEQDSFNRLTDFEFNIKSPLINFLWVKPVMLLKDNVLTVTIPEFQIGSQFTFPARTNTCQVTILVTQINLNQALTREELESTFEINADELNHPERTLTFNLANESISVAAIGLAFFKRTNDIRTPYNSKSFSPANVIGAVVTGGVYVEPPAPLRSHVGYSKEWTFESKLKF